MEQPTLWSVFFTDSKNGWAAGEGGTIIKTSNGGTNWLSQSSLTNRYLTSIYFISSNIGWATGQSGIILKTTNGGLTFVDDKNNFNFPLNFKLSQNYPNPFNSTSSIKYYIPSTQFVTLKIFDMLGREITSLVNEEKSSGNYEVEFDGSSFSSGIYFYRLQAGSFSETKKLILMK